MNDGATPNEFRLNGWPASPKNRPVEFRGGAVLYPSAPRAGGRALTARRVDVRRVRAESRVLAPRGVVDECPVPVAVSKVPSAACAAGTPTPSVINALEFASGPESQPAPRRSSCNRSGRLNAACIAELLDRFSRGRNDLELLVDRPGEARRARVCVASRIGRPRSEGVTARGEVRIFRRALAGGKGGAVEAAFEA